MKFVTGFRPEKEHPCFFPEVTAFKQVKLVVLFNRLKRRHIRVPHSQCPTKSFSGWALTNAFVFALLTLLNTSLSASTDTILILDTQGHTGSIKDVIVTKEKDIITASDDKTIRVFDSNTGQEKRKILGQIGTGAEGRIYAMALSPDERYLAVGGWLSTNGNEEYGNIRIYAYATGQLIKVLRSHQSVVNDLAFSNDSSLLISGSSDTTAKIWNVTRDFILKDTITYHTKQVHAVGLIKRSNNYFAVTAGFDNIIALYDLQKRTVTNSDSHRQKLKYLAINHRFKHIAVGGLDKDIMIYDSHLTMITRSPTQSSPKGLAYSDDGQHLVAGRDSKTNNVGIYAVKKSYQQMFGFKQHTDITMAVGFLDNNTAITAGGNNKEILIWDIHSGKIKRRIEGVGRPILNVGINQDAVAWASAPACSNHPCNKLTKSINLKNFAITELAAPPSSFGRISTTQGDYSLSHSKGGDYQYDNAVLTIKKNNKRKSSIVKNAVTGYRHLSYGWYKDFIVSGGANGQLKIYNKSGIEVATLVGHSGDIWSVALNGDRLVSGSEDQTIRVWNLSVLTSFGLRAQKTIHPMLNIFVGQDNEWVAWSNSGYFNSSVGGDKYAGYHFNRGPQNAARFVGNDKYFETYFRPDIIAKLWQTGSEQKAIAFAGTNTRVKKIEISQALPPQVSLFTKSNIQTSKDTIDVEFHVSSEQDLKETIILHNGVRINSRGIMLTANGAGKKISVPLVPGENIISIKAKNQSAMSDEVLVYASKIDTPQDIFKPTLYMLSVGVSEYENSSYNLSFADDDARAMADTFLAQKGKIYKDVVIRTLVNDKAQSGDLLDQLDWIDTAATSKDVVIIFLAGHGIKDRKGAYYFLGHDADKDKLRRTGIKWSEIQDTITNLSSKVILLADTCHSGDIAGNKRDITSAVKSIINTGSGAVIMTASTGNGYSLETSQWGHGAFTKSFMEGLGEMKADYNQDDIITIKEIDLYVTGRVKELTQGFQNPTTIVPKSIPDFAIGVQ